MWIYAVGVDIFFPLVPDQDNAATRKREQYRVNKLIRMQYDKHFRNSDNQSYQAAGGKCHLLLALITTGTKLSAIERENWANKFFSLIVICLHAGKSVCLRLQQ